MKLSKGGEKMEFSTMQKMDVLELMQICKDNLDFYKAQIAHMEEKMDELEALKNAGKLKEAYEYY